MSQSENGSNEISVAHQESKVNGKIDSIEGQLSFMGEGACEQPVPSSAKEDSSFSLTTLSLFPKRFDDSQDTQDDLRNAPDLPNGHNNPDAVDIVPRTKSLDELLQESEDLPDTEIIGCTKEFVESKMEIQSSGDVEADKDTDEKIVEKSKETIQEDKNENVEGTQVSITDDMETKEIINKEKSNESTVKGEKVEEVSSEEKEKDNDDSSSPSDELTKNDKISKENQGPRKNASTDNIPEIKVSENVSKTNEENPKEVNKEDTFKLEISDSQFLTVPDLEESKENVEPTVEMKAEPTKSEAKVDDKQVEDTKSTSGNTKETLESTESSIKDDVSDKEETKEEEASEECHCNPECHVRMKLLKKSLGNACSQLDGYIKLKKQEEFTNFLKLLTEIELITENKKAEVSQDLLRDAFQDENQGNKKRKSRASKVSKVAINTPKKEVPEKKSRVRESKSEEPMSEINFKNLKGLAVFAKWPNSGWYYPGIIEGLTNSDWKEATNVTVKFYDGLVREMKNINILPAHLIPTASIVCDLDDETEMVVLSTNRVDNNSVEFTLSTKEGTGKNLELNFNKLAIKALHMKSIKQQLEPNMDVMPKKMHMVSLDNLVSGRRSRVRTHKDDDDENAENTTPRKNVRKSVAPDPEKSLNVDESENTATPTKTSPNKRGVTAVERSASKRTAITPNKRMKQ